MVSHASSSVHQLRADAGDLLDSLRRIVRHLRLVESESEQATGVTAAQLFVLSRLASGPASSIRELAQRTLTDPSSVSVVLSKLEERGYVQSTPDAGDKRRRVIALTRSGKAVLGRAPRLPQVHLLAALEGLPAGRRRAMVAGLQELVLALGAGDTKPELFFENEPPRGARLRRKPLAKAKIELAR